VCCTINTHPKSAKAVKPLIFNYFLEMGFRWLKLFARHLATGFLSRAWDFDRIAEEQLALPQDGEDDHLPLACKALNCVQTRDTKSKLGKAENRCLSVLTDDRGGLKRTT
jgi:hypothetical protein